MTWKRWYDERPSDHTLLYMWRVSPRKLFNKILQPEWTAKMHYCGMGYSENEWWPSCSNWDGYSRTVDQTLEWRVAEEGEEEGYVNYIGLDLRPDPFTGLQPKIDYKGIWISAPPYKAESLTIDHYWGTSYGWHDANKLEAAWNRRDEYELAHVQNLCFDGARIIKQLRARKYELEQNVERLEWIKTAAENLINDVKRRYPGEELRCEYMKLMEHYISVYERNQQ